MSDIDRAKLLYGRGGYTCVLAKRDRVYTSSERGVAPLVKYAQSRAEFCGFSAADKIVGKAAALLYVYLGVGYVYAEVMSRSAAEILNRYGIGFECGTFAENIINRRGDGVCPMEQAVADVNDPKEAFILIEDKIKTI